MPKHPTNVMLDISVTPSTGPDLHLKQLLANPILEDYTIEMTDDLAPGGAVR